MYTTNITDGWASPKSYIKQSQNSGLFTFRGKFSQNGILYEFSLREQRNNAYLLRGSIAVIDPSTGKVLKIIGKRRDEWVAKHPNQSPDTAGRALDVRANVLLRSLDIDEVKKGIACAASKLYQREVALIIRAYGSVVTPATITPLLAVAKYANAYLKAKHKRKTDSTISKYKSSLSNIATQLPGKPMRDISTKEVVAAFKACKASNDNKKRFFAFWEFCIDGSYCIGTNPVPIPDTNHHTASAMKKAMCADSMSPKQQDKFDELLLSHSCGLHCGIALMRHGGFSAKIATEFKWGNVIWGDDLDYVRIQYFREGIMGATHNYTAPLFPTGALVLRKRYEELKKNFSEKQLSKMPIVSSDSNRKEALNSALLLEHTKPLLRTVGFTDEDFKNISASGTGAVASRILLNTYKQNLNTNCGLKNEQGVAQFLEHLSLQGYTTDEYYTSFVAEESGVHLLNILRCLQPLSQISNKDSIKNLPQNKEEHILFPNDTRQCVGCVASLKLAPGEEIIIACPHGVTGHINVQ